MWAEAETVIESILFSGWFSVRDWYKVAAIPLGAWIMCLIFESCTVGRERAKSFAGLLGFAGGESHGAADGHVGAGAARPGSGWGSSSSRVLKSRKSRNDARKGVSPFCALLFRVER